MNKSLSCEKEKRVTSISAGRDGKRKRKRNKSQILDVRGLKPASNVR